MLLTDLERLALLMALIVLLEYGLPGGTEDQNTNSLVVGDRSGLPAAFRSRSRRCNEDTGTAAEFVVN